MHPSLKKVGRFDITYLAVISLSKTECSHSFMDLILFVYLLSCEE